MINPELYYRLWEHEHADRVEAAGLRRATREVAPGQVARHSWMVKRSAGILVGAAREFADILPHGRPGVGSWWRRTMTGVPKSS
jgi:hypothetical protein